MLHPIIGYAAAFLTTVSFVPQAIKTMRSRNTSGISLSMYVLFTFGVILWLVYGISTGQWPIIIANAITVVLATIILGFKIVGPGES
jgi:MtN3 and saliva related transmembrane protein